MARPAAPPTPGVGNGAALSQRLGRGSDAAQKRTAAEQTRTLPVIALGATAQAEIVEVVPVERVPRTLQADLLTPAGTEFDEN